MGGQCKSGGHGPTFGVRWCGLGSYMLDKSLLLPHPQRLVTHPCFFTVIPPLPVGAQGLL